MHSGYSNLPEELKESLGNMLTVRDAASLAAVDREHAARFKETLTNLEKKYKSLQTIQMDLFWLAYPARQPRTDADWEEWIRHQVNYACGQRELEEFTKMRLGEM